MQVDRLAALTLNLCRLYLFLFARCLNHELVDRLAGGMRLPAVSIAWLRGTGSSVHAHSHLESASVRRLNQHENYVVSLLLLGLCFDVALAPRVHLLTAQ